MIFILICFNFVRFCIVGSHTVNYAHLQHIKKRVKYVCFVLFTVQNKLCTPNQTVYSGTFYKTRRRLFILKPQRV